MKVIKTLKNLLKEVPEDESPREDAASSAELAIEYSGAILFSGIFFLLILIFG